MVGWNTFSSAWLPRLCAVLAALAVWLLAPLAHAFAPMCDEAAQTIDAPAPVLPQPVRELVASKSCHETAGEVLGTAPVRDHLPTSVTVERVERALPILIVWPPRPTTPDAPAAAALRVPELSAHSDGVYRPPRA